MASLAIMRRFGNRYTYRPTFFCRRMVMRRHVVCMSFVGPSITPATKSTNVGSRYLGEGSSEKDEIFQIARGGLVYTIDW